MELKFHLFGAENVIMMMPYFAVAFFMLWISKVVFQKTTAYDIDDELTEQDNPAMGILFGCYLIGIAIALMSITQHYSVKTVGDIKEGIAGIVIYGAMSIILIRISIVILDKLILNQFKVHVEITRDKNIGVAFVTGAGCIASGLMIAGVMSGESINFLRGMVDAVVFWGVGQLILVVGSELFQIITPYDDQKLLEGSNTTGEIQNIPVGIMWAGFLIAQGWIVKCALTGTSSDLFNESILTIVSSACGLILFAVVRLIADKFLLPRSKMSKEICEDYNPAAGIIAGISFIVIALLMTKAITPTINVL